LSDEGIVKSFRAMSVQKFLQGLTEFQIEEFYMN
jgi:hypothetical protein